MKLNRIFAALFATFLSFSALAQPGPGPGPTPSPFLQSGNRIQPLTPTSGMTFPSSVTGGNMGTGTINALGLYVNGAPASSISGSLALNNVVVGNNAGSVKDSGVQIVLSIPAGRVWTNPTSTNGPPISSDVINILAGTPGAPPYSSYLDPTTGMYFSAAGNIDFSIGGNRALRITTTSSTNYVQIANAATPSIFAVGGNLPLQLFGSGSGGIDMLNSANGTQFLQRASRIGTSTNYGYMVANPAADSGVALTYTATACITSGAICASPPTAISFNWVTLGAGTFQVNASPVVTQANLGTGVYTALGINVGSAGAPVVFNGAGGTPSSMTGTNITGLPLAGVTGFGTGVATALALNAGAAGAPVINGAAQNVAFASLGSAGTAGRVYRANNVGTKGCWMEDNGTRWRPWNNRCILFTMDAPSSGIQTPETVIAQYQMPAALLQVGDVIRVWVTVTKSGTTNTGTVTTRIGTNGTTGDTGLLAAGVMLTTSHQAASFWDFRVVDATHMALVGGTSNIGWGDATTNGVPPTSTAISNISNSLWVDISITGGATDAVIANTAAIELVSSAQ